MLLIFLLWFGLCILVGMLASSKNRSGVGFFILSVLSSPITGCIIILVIGNNEGKKNIDNNEVKKKKEEEKVELQISRKIEGTDKEDLMKDYNIVFKNKKYCFEKYKYDKLEDAINYAKTNWEKK